MPLEKDSLKLQDSIPPGEAIADLFRALLPDINQQRRHHLGLISSRNEWGKSGIAESELGKYLWTQRLPRFEMAGFGPGSYNFTAEDISGWPAWFTPEELNTFNLEGCRLAILFYSDEDRVHLLFRKGQQDSSSTLEENLHALKQDRNALVADLSRRLIGKSYEDDGDLIQNIMYASIFDARINRHRALNHMPGVDWYEGQWDRHINESVFTGPLVVEPYQRLDIKGLPRTAFPLDYFFIYFFNDPESITETLRVARNKPLMRQIMTYLYGLGEKPIELQSVAPVAIEPELHLFAMGYFQDEGTPYHGPLSMSYIQTHAITPEGILLASEILNRTNHFRGYNLVTGYAVKMFSCDYPIILLNLEESECNSNNERYRKLLSTLNMHDRRVVLRMRYEFEEILIRP